LLAAGSFVCSRTLLRHGLDGVDDGVVAGAAAVIAGDVFADFPATWHGIAAQQQFLRQSRMMAELWGARGVETRYDPLPGLDHFTVLDPLFDRDSGVVKRLVKLALE
jgi:hypothetical protein